MTTARPLPPETNKIMQAVLLATLPGFVALLWYFGWGTAINIAIAAVSALSFEAAVIALRKRPVMFYLRDGSALVTAVLLGLALPPLAPWWLVVLGTFFAIVVAKHLYGGLGNNLFNPAMVGYAVLLVSFPAHMSSWLTPRELLGDGLSLPSLVDSLRIVFGTMDIADGVTGATPLEVFRHNQGLLVSQLYAQEPLLDAGAIAAVGWEWVNLGFLLGGGWLLYKRIFTWHAPLAMLAALALMAMLFYDSGSSNSGGSPLFHLFSGATMLGAFFIVTEPVTSATSTRGKLLYGAAIGVLVYIIRAWGGYPDAIAFAVLLMNFAAPLLDNHTRPRSLAQGEVPQTEEKR
ncbi:MAG: RnfABCDGE type electron transport complex subunit D [Porticoccaceae bacterium]